ncbi:citrulline utilization hydrolase CtlX [Lutibacter sp.]|uniref:citrulline utilization hydrolase CtlX n=1 Tax=Lutibacter sp. TaxID=1925666 RepID=UPI0027365173|nr:arginine deiminase-related protein [Lutibacter sp.]MDP3313461.1 arginine deiminase-related protein [Lutibacter sp.]
MEQITNTILMIRPVSFRMNEQTAVNNYYQKVLESLNSETVQLKALQEFDNFVDKLREAGVQVIVIEDSKDSNTPDSIFPNNWISFHENGDVALYPMFAENRRLERREDVFTILEEQGFEIENVIDYTLAEKEGLFLEGTGSLLLDRINRKAYCALSPRADEDLFIEFCEDFEYTPVPFVSYQTVNEKRLPIYHTNVMMCIAEEFVIICLDSIDDKKDKKNVIKHLKEDYKEIITISETQVAQFAGNMLQVLGNNGEKYIVMSQSALDSLNKGQLNAISKYCKIISSPIDTIEACGGGSVRCMMAEVFLPKKS